MVVMRLYRERKTLDQIAAEVGVGRSTVKRDIERARREWRDQIPQDYQELLDEKLAELHDVRIEVMEAWRASMQPTLETRTSETKDGTFTTEITRPPQPNAALMGQLVRTLELEARLRGMLDQRSDKGAEDGPELVEVVVNTREDVGKLKVYTTDQFVEIASKAREERSQSAEAAG